MSSSRPQVLQELGRLEKSSPSFHDQFLAILGGEEYREFVRNLKRDDSTNDSTTWLVEYLDKVHRHIPSLTLRSSQRRLSAISNPLVTLSGSV